MQRSACEVNRLVSRLNSSGPTGHRHSMSSFSRQWRQLPCGLHLRFSSFCTSLSSVKSRNRTVTTDLPVQTSWTLDHIPLHTWCDQIDQDGKWASIETVALKKETFQTNKTSSISQVTVCIYQLSRTFCTTYHRHRQHTLRVQLYLAN